MDTRFIKLVYRIEWPLAATIAIAAAAVFLNAGTADAADIVHGKVLYETHCGACHTTQAHWRDKRIVKTWIELLGQVGRWQKVAGQNWGESDIGDTAAYLNERFYNLPCPASACKGPQPAGVERPALVLWLHPAGSSSQ